LKCEPHGPIVLTTAYQTNANGELLQFTYNPSDQMLTLTDGKNQVTKWNYDLYGRVTNKLDAANTVIFRYNYDANSRLTNRWTVAKGDTFYVYDFIGNLTNVDYPGTLMDITLKYDLLNRLTNVVDVIGTTKFNYTDAGQLLTEDGPWANDTVSYGYSARRRSSMSVLQPNAAAWTENYGYDQFNRLSNIVSAAGNFIYDYYSTMSDRVEYLGLGGLNSYSEHTYIENQYDTLARLTSTKVKKDYSTTLNQHSYAMNDANQRTKQTFTGGNYVDYTYDSIGQLKTAKGTESDTTTARLNEQFGYEYDKAWNLNFRTNNALVQTFNVNNLNELSSVTRGGTLTVAGNTTATATNVTVNSLTAVRYADKTWAKDSIPMVDGTTNFTAIAKTSFGLADTNTVTVDLRATNTFAYDLNGNLRTNGTEVLDYDDENRLVTNYVAAAWKSEFVYDGRSRRRVQRDYGWSSGAWVKTNETRLVYDGNLILQHRDSGNTPTLTLTRGRDLSGSRAGAGGIGGLLAMTESSGTNNYYQADDNGNVTCLIATNQLIVAKYLYDPFGSTLAISGPKADTNPYRFSSKPVHAASGKYDYLYRWYSPELQRWLNEDSIQEAGGLNLFTFVNNSPFLFIDALGLEGEEAGASAFPPGKVKEAINRAKNIADKAGKAVAIVGAGIIVKNLAKHVDDADKKWQEPSAGTVDEIDSAKTAIVLDMQRALGDVDEAGKLSLGQFPGAGGVEFIEKAPSRWEKIKQLRRKLFCPTPNPPKIKHYIGPGGSIFTTSRDEAPPPGYVLDNRFP